ISFTIHVISPSAAFTTEYSTVASCTPNGGLCNYSLEAGDEKAYINNLNIVTTGPNNTSYKYVYFFCAQSSSYDDIASACTDRILISGANALQQNTITGIPNGVQNVFRAATVDIAGNIGLFLNLDSNTTDCPAGKCQEVTPQEVLGLLDENSCFVATAAYGSPMQKNVKTLRRFRDQVLRKTSWGQIFIKTYYTLSPSLARWIAQNSQRRSAARFFLTPIVFVVTAVVDYPWLTFFFIIFIFGGFFWIKRSGEEPS
ncbi:hypothetical protein K2X05_03310, partial [bacterium]|nr:hypothetical protein [bacterium]